ncbi:hypothetical protein Pfo_003543, partial [Paulownia fortunei]
KSSFGWDSLTCTVATNEEFWEIPGEAKLRKKELPHYHISLEIFANSVANGDITRSLAIDPWDFDKKDEFNSTYPVSESPELNDGSLSIGNLRGYPSVNFTNIPSTFTLPREKNKTNQKALGHHGLTRHLTHGHPSIVDGNMEHEFGDDNSSNSTSDITLSSPKSDTSSEDYVGAIDGTLISAWAPARKHNACHSRKPEVSQNVMAMCNFNLMFMYVLAGWESKYYMVNSRYYNFLGFLAPYQQQWYHINSWKGFAREAREATSPNCNYMLFIHNFIRKYFMDDQFFIHVENGEFNPQVDDDDDEYYPHAS